MDDITIVRPLDEVSNVARVIETGSVLSIIDTLRDSAFESCMPTVLLLARYLWLVSTPHNATGLYTGPEIKQILE